MGTGFLVSLEQKKRFRNVCKFFLPPQGAGLSNVISSTFFSEGNLICSSDVPADGKFHEADDCKRLSHYPDRFNLRRMRDAARVSC